MNPSSPIFVPGSMQGARHPSITRRRRRRSRSCFGCICVLLLAAAAAFAPAVRSHLIRRSPLRPAIPTARSAEPEVPLAEAARARGIPRDPIPAANLVVEKSDLKLHFRSGETILKTHPIALGFGGLGDKRQRDDGLTPEGEFRICQKTMERDPRAWSDVWMRLNCPLREDADRGLAEELITEEQHGEIHRAWYDGDPPPQNTRLGSGIGIHVGGVEPSDWTLGCIALEKDAGIEVYEQVGIGATVVIQP